MQSLPAHHGGRRARKKEGLPTSGRPWTAPFCLQEHAGSVSFSKSQTAVGRENIFLGFVFQDTTPELSEKSLDARGAGPGRQRRSISGVSGTGAPPPPRHLRTVSFFNLPHPVPPILPRAGGRACSERRAPAPPCEGETHLLAWPPQTGRQARRGRGGQTGYAGDGAPRGAALGETRRAVAGVQSARRPLPRA